jgi:hypothetical protein
MGKSYTVFIVDNNDCIVLLRDSKNFPTIENTKESSESVDDDPSECRIISDKVDTSLEKASKSL